LTIILWILQIFLALIFLMAGSIKLGGQAIMMATFEKIGIGQWFRYLTGCIELVSAILLLIPKFTFVGALLLCATMIGAMITHLFVIGGNPTLAAVLLMLSAFVAWQRIARNHSGRTRESWSGGRSG
jgi:uncharacterized membrane protein YphA (DoxX/SURF4 family)